MNVQKMCFFGYSSEQTGYKVLSLDSNFVFVSRDVKFYESVFPFKLKSSVGDKYSFSVDLSDPFSCDEPLISSSLQENISIGDLGVSLQSDGVGAVHNLAKTPSSDVRN